MKAIFQGKLINNTIPIQLSHPLSLININGPPQVSSSSCQTEQKNAVASIDSMDTFKYSSYIHGFHVYMDI